MSKDGKPKQPKTAYFLFQDDMRPKIAAKHPELASKVAELASLIGAEWKKLTPEQKKVYEDKAAAAKAEFEKTHGPVVRGKKAAKEGKPAKGKKEEGGPKRALSAYMFYSNAVRSKISAENPGKPVTEIAKLIGESWKTISAGEKSKYEAQAAADKARYEAEKAK